MISTNRLYNLYHMNIATVESSGKLGKQGNIKNCHNESDCDIQYR
jgi:hypothetical protein